MLARSMAQPGTSPAGAGKADRFPIKDEKLRAVVPDSEGQEGPLLINPAEVNPDDHLIFQSNGMIRARTPEGEATLKFWHPEANRIRLQPANSKMSPIYVKEASVLGIVVGVVRNMI